MDDIAHVLWSIAIFYHYNWILAALFGILPDLLVFIPFYVAKFLSGRLKSLNDCKPKYDVRFYNKWVGPMYNVTHSLLVATVFIVICSALFGYHVEYWAMIIHILVDIPSHQRAWFGTKVLWPVSHWQFNGVSWATREYMLANYTAIALVYSLRLFGF